MSGSDLPDDGDVRTSWLRGVLAGGEAYGYELARALEASGIGPVAGGSLYPALVRQEKLGNLRSEWRAGEGGPGRKYYALTPAGRRALARDGERWRAFAASLERVLDKATSR
jgi:PadR family transcriptional regulator PadR